MSATYEFTDLENFLDMLATGYSGNETHDLFSSALGEYMYRYL